MVPGFSPEYLSRRQAGVSCSLSLSAIHADSQIISNAASVALGRELGRLVNFVSTAVHWVEKNL